MLLVGVLLVAIVAGVVVLFVRGFRVEDLVKKQDAVVTPTRQVWLVETPDYAQKMDAYKAGISHSANGLATHVYEADTQWTWVAGVYLTQEQAQAVLQDGNLPAESVCREYSITGKEFKLDPSAAVTGNAVLATIQQTFNHLLTLRDLLTQEQSTNDAILGLTECYNLLRQQVTELNTSNATLKSEVVAAIIYAANQNILGLYEVIFATQTGPEYLSVVNTAIAKSIFSLDNF